MKYILTLLFALVIFGTPQVVHAEQPSIDVLQQDFDKAFDKGALHIEAPKAFNLKIWGKSGNQSSIQGMTDRITLVNLWATWCPPCLEELPSLNMLQRMLGDKEFQVLAILADHNDLDKGHKLFQEERLDELKAYADISGRALSIDGVEGLPTTFILSPDGQEIGRINGPAEWDSSDVVHFISQLKEFYYPTEL